MSASEYISAIDWAGGAVAAVVLVLVSIVVYRFVAAATTEIGSMLPGAGAPTSDLVVDVRTGLPIDSWLCAKCHSVNTPNAARCYAGCGPRAAIEGELPEDARALQGGPEREGA